MLPMESLLKEIHMVKPSTGEEEYFAREEAEKLKRLAREKHDKIAIAEKERLKNLHWMHCPKCGMELSEILFRGVSLDKCFNCHGVYLDDGELEKLAGHESGFMQSMISLFK